MNEAPREAVPEKRRHGLLHLAHYSELGGHSRRTLVQHSLQRERYLPHVSSDVLCTLRSARDYTWLPVAYFEQQKLMKLFPVAGPLR